MPARHSKNTGDRSHFSHHEKTKTGMGTVTQRLGADSQLPFGYCALSMQPTDDPVVSPTGRLYSREFILEYLLAKQRDLKQKWQEFEAQQNRIDKDHEKHLMEVRTEDIQSFLSANDGVGAKRKIEVAGTVANSEYEVRRRKLIDDTDPEAKKDQLQKMSPWIPQFTPQAAASLVAEPPKRPPSPFSGRPLRAKDLIPVNLLRDPEGSISSSLVRFICPVSRKTITNQKVVLIKSTGTIMLADTAEQLAYPSMICPTTGRKFKKEDVLELVQAASAFSATGSVEASKYRPTLN